MQRTRQQERCFIVELIVIFDRLFAVLRLFSEISVCSVRCVFLSLTEGTEAQSFFFPDPLRREGSGKGPQPDGKAERSYPLVRKKSIPCFSLSVFSSCDPTPFSIESSVKLLPISILPMPNVVYDNGIYLAVHHLIDNSIIPDPDSILLFGSL